MSLTTIGSLPSCTRLITSTLLRLAIIVPTYNELANVVPLAKQLKQALGNQPFRVVFADDSNDGTTEEIHGLAGVDESISINHSPLRRGLAKAVVDVLVDTLDDIVLVMDGDLQHPPPVVPAVLAAITSGADIAVASRYAPGASELGLSTPWRRAVSWASTRLAQASLPPARLTTDPLSGFFAFRRTCVDPASLRPVGFKILLEVLVRSDALRVVDIPYTFDRRQSADSKAAPREAVAFLWHLMRLRLSR